MRTDIDHRGQVLGIAAQNDPITAGGIDDEVTLTTLQRLETESWPARIGLEFEDRFIGGLSGSGGSVFSPRP